MTANLSPQKRDHRTAFAQAAVPVLKAKAARPSPVSIRFSAEERATLEVAANGKPLSTYIRDCVLSKRPVAKDGVDPALLGQILGALKASELLSGLREMEWAEKNGQIHLDIQSAHMLRNACQSVMLMRADLMRALGLRKT